MKPLAVFAMVGAAVAGFFHHTKVGPVDVEDDDEDERPAARDEEKLP